MNNSEYWKKIFETKAFDLSNDIHFITATEIKSISGREPRIMAKIDSSADLPSIFKDNNYFLLPVRNGEYAIVRGNGFHALEKCANPTNHVSRIKFNLTTAGRGLGEMQYLDYCYNSGALEEVLGISPLYQSIRGREYSKHLKFKVNNTELSVNSIQFEVDSGLEGENHIVLIEAKVKTPKDFIVRQLFFPYLHYKILAPQKEIIPVFFTYDLKHKIYNFWIYEFKDPANYNSIRLKEVKALTITTKHEVELTHIKAKGSVNYKDLIPQANDLNKVIELVHKVNEGVNNYTDIASHFKFDQRQSSYYREAAETLGLVESIKGIYRLTQTGTQLVSLPALKRNLFMVELLSNFRLIADGLDFLKKTGKLKRLDIINLVSSRSKLTGTTIGRRAQSLSAWFKWIATATGLFTVNKTDFVIK